MSKFKVSKFRFFWLQRDYESTPSSESESSGLKKPTKPLLKRTENNRATRLYGSLYYTPWGKEVR